MGTKAESKERSGSMVFGLVVAGAAAVAGLVFMAHALWVFRPWTPTNLEQLGTAVGGVVASAWALAGVVLFYLAFQAQRQELEQTRELLAGQRHQLELQNWEATFFHLLERQQSIVQGMRLRSTSGEELTGRTALKWYLDPKFANEWRAAAPTAPGKHTTAALIALRTLKREKEDVAAYLSNLVMLLSFADTAQPPERVNFYGDVIRSQLTPSETALIGYACLAAKADDGAILSLVRRFNLLGHLDPEALVDKAHADTMRAVVGGRWTQIKGPE